MGLFYLCLCSNSPSELQPHSKEILALRGWEGEKNGKKNMYAKSCLNSRLGPDRCHASPDYPTELFSISKTCPHDPYLQNICKSVSFLDESRITIVPGTLMPYGLFHQCPSVQARFLLVASSAGTAYSWGELTNVLPCLYCNHRTL